MPFSLLTCSINRLSSLAISREYLHIQDNSFFITADQCALRSMDSKYKSRARSISDIGIE